VALLALGGVLFYVLGGTKFDEGDCIRQASGTEVEQVDCDASDAQRIVGVHDEELTQGEFFADDSTCSDFPETQQQFWVGNTFGDDGTIYCTVPVG
jgi:hypothetical protein